MFAADAQAQEPGGHVALSGELAAPFDGGFAATSLGGVETTIERRSKLPGQGHLPPGLLRLSVGCEHIDDLWSDLSTALDQATRPAG